MDLESLELYKNFNVRLNKFKKNQILLYKLNNLLECQPGYLLSETSTFAVKARSIPIEWSPQMGLLSSRL
jgi:hypothetical protein